MCLYLEKEGLSVNAFLQHLRAAEDLKTTYEATRAGFVAMALEKSRQATPFIEQARVLKAAAAALQAPIDLLSLHDLQPALLVASGVSDKATAYLQASDREDAILSLIRNYLEPQGSNWIEELVYRFLLTRGDSLGGAMRNIAGALAQRKVTRAVVAALTLLGQPYQYLDIASNIWLPKPESDADIELRVRGLSWLTKQVPRTLVYNIKVPAVNKNVDLCLLNCSAKELASGKAARLTYQLNDLYLALGELKGGIDPAGADEHWKTAQAALGRIQKSFSEASNLPLIFFIGAAIERDMANEIWLQLQNVP
jgi:hypothetical protein